eukprot:gene10853-14570_t
MYCNIIWRGFAVTGRKSKNVANKKNKLDAIKNKLYQRLGVKILMAAKSGGPDPSKNIELSRALKEAAAIKLPKENVDRALSKATDVSTVGYGSGVYEVFGHDGVGLIIQTLTDNSNRANKLIKAWANKSEVKIASIGSIMFQFNHMGVFIPHQEFDKDKVVEVAIESNIEDIDIVERNPVDYKWLMESDAASTGEDDVVNSVAFITTPVDQIAALQDSLQQANIDGISKIVYLPNELITTSPESYELNQKLIDGFEELDDVDEVFHNMKISN